MVIIVFNNCYLNYDCMYNDSSFANKIDQVSAVQLLYFIVVSINTQVYYKITASNHLVMVSIYKLSTFCGYFNFLYTKVDEKYTQKLHNM